MPRIKDIPDDQLKELIKNSVKDAKDADITDAKIKEYRELFNDDEWTIGMKGISGLISPVKHFEKGEEVITGIFLATGDAGSDNIVYHYVIYKNRVVTVKDRGYSQELTVGCNYKFDCSTSIDTDNDRTYYVLKEDKHPEEIGQLTDLELLKHIKKAALPIYDLKDGDVAVVEMKMTRKINSFKNTPTMYLDDMGGTGFNFRATGVQEPEDKNQDTLFISLLFFPQKYGEQTFWNVFPEWGKFKEDYIIPNQADLRDVLITWLIPSPPDISTFAIGRVSVEQGGEYDGSVSMFAIGLFQDHADLPDYVQACVDGDVEIPEEDLEKPEAEDEEEEAAEEEEDDEPEEEESDLQEATDDVIKKWLKMNQKMPLTQLNNILEKRGYKPIKKKRADALRED